MNQAEKKRVYQADCRDRAERGERSRLREIVRDKSILWTLITACDEISEAAAYGEQDDVEKSRGACGEEDILRRGRSRKQKLHTYKGCASSFV